MLISRPCQCLKPSDFLSQVKNGVGNSLQKIEAVITRQQHIQQAIADVYIHFEAVTSLNLNSGVIDQAALAREIIVFSPVDRYLVVGDRDLFERL